MMLFLLPVLIGVALATGILHVWLWRHRRQDRLAPCVAGWCLGTLVGLVAHYVQLATADPAWAVFGAKLAWVAAALLLPFTIGLAHGLSGRPLPRRTLTVVVGASLGIAGLVVFTDLVVTTRVSFKADLLSPAFLHVEPGPLMALLAPATATAFLYFWRTALGRGAQLEPGERRLVQAGFVVYVALGVNDILHAARVIRAERVFDLAFVAVAAGFTYILVRRYGRVHDHLEEEVAARTRDLETRTLWLDGLVRAGQSLMAGLDLTRTLERITAEARQIAGSPHVNVLLVDRQAGIFRLGAASGAPVPEGFCHELDHSYSGKVARTGRPLFVADVQNTPGNPLADRDREYGLVTYLGLPIKKGGEVLGVLTINTEAPREYPPEELAYLSSFADQAGTAIDNARLFGEAAKRERRLATLTTLTQGLTSTLSADEVLDRIARDSVALFGASVTRLWVVEDGGRTLGLRAEAGQRTMGTGLTRIAIGQGIVGRVAATRTPVVIEDLENDERRLNSERLRSEGLVSLAVVPLMRADRMMGAL